MRALALAFLAMAACRAPVGRSTVLKPDQFEDIPVPREAKYRSDRAKSCSYRTDTFRCGKFLYEYRGKVEDVAGYFKQNMVRTPYSWKFEGEQGTAAGSTTLVFTKNDERCLVDIDHVPRQTTGEPNVVILVRLNYQYRK